MFIFSYENMRGAPLKELREKWSDSRFFLGKNKVMQIALGRDSETAFRPGLDKVSQALAGQVGLLFTNKPRDEVLSFFKAFKTLDYARYGSKATESFEVKAGLLDLPFTMAEQLRALGMPVELDHGKVRLTRDFIVCEKGDLLSSEQSHLLKHFAKPMAYFRLSMLAMWERESEEFEVLAEGMEAAMEEDEEEEGEGDSSGSESEEDEEDMAAGGGAGN